MTETIAFPASDAAREPTARRYGEARGFSRRRIASLAIAIALEALIILLILTLGWRTQSGTEDDTALVSFEVSGAAPQAEEEPAAADAETTPQPATTEAEALPEPVPDEIEPLPTPQPVEIPPLTLPSSRPAPAPPPSQTAPPPQSSGPPRVYGPVDAGPVGGSTDSARVGTAPNGEPLYAARWYREPTRGELAGYLSTATGPGSALIACRTVRGFYVEDCELLGESPQGSRIGRAVLAAAWQFRVRPAVIGGRSQFGSWVRIRIDYSRSASP